MRTKAMLAAAVVIVMAAVAGAGVQNARAVLPPGNTAEQWDKIAEDTVVGSGAFQNEGLIYMAYASNAMYRAVAPGERRGQSADAALVEAAYTTLSHYFPAQAATLDALHSEALAAIDRQRGASRRVPRPGRSLAARLGDMARSRPRRRDARDRARHTPGRLHHRVGTRTSSSQEVERDEYVPHSSGASRRRTRVAGDRAARRRPLS